MPLPWKGCLCPQSTSFSSPLSLSLPISHLIFLVQSFSSSFCLLHQCLCLPISQSLLGEGVSPAPCLTNQAESFVRLGGNPAGILPAFLSLSLSVALVAEVAVSPMLPGFTHMLTHRRAGLVLDTHKHTHGKRLYFKLQPAWIRDLSLAPVACSRSDAQSRV